MPWTKEDRSFKTLINRRTTSSGKAWYEELGDNTINVHSDEIWASPSQAVIDGVAELRTLFTLTEDVSVGSQQCYYAYESGNRLKEWISDKYGLGYAIHLYQNTGAEIFPTDVSTWFFDYQTGILTFNASTAGFSKPFKITGYRYIGSKGGGGTISGGEVYDIVDATANGQTAFPLSQAPINPYAVRMVPQGGIELVNSLDFTVSGQSVIWLDGTSSPFETSDKILFTYFKA
jgi:hypothetical protein